MANQVTFEQWKKQNPERCNDWETCLNCHGMGHDEVDDSVCIYCKGEGARNKAYGYFVADLIADLARLKRWTHPTHTALDASPQGASMQRLSGLRR